MPATCPTSRLRRTAPKKHQPNSVFKHQGTSLVIHASADDHKTDPAGNSGDRIACGAITPPG